MVRRYEGAHSTVRNVLPAKIGENVDIAMAAVTARMENPQRARENSSAEPAPAPVTATFVDPVEHGINTAETRAEEDDAESHRKNSNARMVVTRKQSAEREKEEQQAQMLDPGLCEQLQVIDRLQHANTVSLDDVLPEDVRQIAKIQWFWRREILAHSELSFEVFEHCAWDGEFSWGISIDALSSRVWHDVIAVDEADLCFRGSFDSKRVRDVSEVFKGF